MITPNLSKAQRLALHRQAGYIPAQQRDRLAKRAENNRNAAARNYPSWSGREADRKAA